MVVQRLFNYLNSLPRIYHFDVYLDSMPFKVYTDHNPLTFLKTMRNKNQRLVRLSLALPEYNLEIQHIPGSENVVADALSRCII